MERGAGEEGQRCVASLGSPGVRGGHQAPSAGQQCNAASGARSQTSPQLLTSLLTPALL